MWDPFLLLTLTFCLVAQLAMASSIIGHGLESRAIVMSLASGILERGAAMLSKLWPGFGL